MEKHSIVPILEHYGGAKLQERYGWQKIKCPFHDDSHASATVNIEENAFNCFGCGVKGDTYKVIMTVEGVGFREAYTFAERVTGESGNSLSKKSSTRRGVSSESGIIARRRGYSPPRLRSRTTRGA